MLKIKKEHVIYEMSGVNPPVARARSGEQVCFETMDCYGETIRSEQDTVSLVPWKAINPATGPLYVEGAMPGDVLRVEIQYIRLSNQGVMAVGPGAGTLRHLLKEERTKLLTIQDGEVIFNERLRLPLSPMVGVIGTAPKGNAVPNGTPGRHGSNMDCKLICEGSVLYLPVNVEGALLSVSDLHAAMGDGEVVICGVETSGEVIVQTDVIKDFSAPLPLLVSHRRVMTVASAETLDQAAAQATENMARFLTERLELDIAEAGMLMSAACDLRICQIVDPLVTVRMECPEQILERYGVILP